MSRYQITPYQSVYRDPQSVNINKELRQRFVQNFATDDALAGALDQMVSRQAEGDLELKRQLEQSVREGLEERAALGNYESSGMEIARSARDFTKKYAPLKKNYDLEQAYREEAKKLAEENKIDPETYQKGMKLSEEMNKQGLQIDENGVIDPKSFYSGYRFVEDVNISELMDERMKNLSMEMGHKRVKRVGEGKDAKYSVLTETGWEEMSSERVQAVFNDIIRDPKVAAALNQKAILRTFDKSPEELQQIILEDSKEKLGLIEEYEKAKSKTKNADQKDIYQQVIDEYKAYLENNSKALMPNQGEETADVENLLSRARVIVQNNEITQKSNVAQSSYAIRNITKSIDEEDYDALWLKQQGNDISTYYPAVFTDTEVGEINNPGGASTTDVANYNTTLASQEKFVMDGVADALGQVTNLQGEPLTADDILNYNYDSNLKNKAGAILDKFRQKIVYIRTQKYIQQQRLDKAKEAAGVEASFKDFNTKTIGREDLKVSEVLDKARAITGNPDMDIHDLYGIFSKFRGARPDIRWSRNTATAEEVQAARDLAEQILGIDPGIFNISQKQSSSKLILDYLNEYDSTDSKAAKRINEELQKTSKLQAGTKSSSNAPGITSADVTKNTDAMNNRFLGEGVPSYFSIYFEGNLNNTSGGGATTIEDFMEYHNMKDAPEITKVLYPVTPIAGVSTVVFSVAGEDADGNKIKKDILVPTSNLEQVGLSTMFSSPIYKLEQELGMNRVAGNLEPIIEFTDQNNNVTGSIRYKLDEKDGVNDIAYVTNSNGVEKVYPANSNELQSIILQATIKDGAAFRTKFR